MGWRGFLPPIRKKSQSNLVYAFRLAFTFLSMMRHGIFLKNSCKIDRDVVPSSSVHVVFTWPAAGKCKKYSLQEVWMDCFVFVCFYWKVCTRQLMCMSLAFLCTLKKNNRELLWCTNLQQDCTLYLPVCLRNGREIDVSHAVCPETWTVVNANILKSVPVG